MVPKGTDAGREVAAGEAVSEATAPLGRDEDENCSFPFLYMFSRQGACWTKRKERCAQSIVEGVDAAARSQRHGSVLHVTWLSTAWKSGTEGQRPCGLVL